MIGRGLRSDTVAMLGAAMDHVNSVPHTVGLRWVFYRLLQGGQLASKGDYNKLKVAVSKARKDFYNGWMPDTLEDSGRAIASSPFPMNKAGMLKALPLYIDLYADMYVGQDYVPFLVYESATVNGQFSYYAPWCDRTSFRGDASIPHKWDIAKRCDELHDLYGLPVHILYFGDLDAKGLQIPESAMKDITKWAEYDIEYKRFGITEEQAVRFGLPERDDKPGVYEWESLSSEDAGTVIVKALDSIVDLGSIEQVIKQSAADTASFREDVKQTLQAVA